MPPNSTRASPRTALLGYQESARKEFGWRLDLGMDSASFLHDMKPPTRDKPIVAGVRDVRRETSRLPESPARRGADADAGQAVSHSPPARVGGAVVRRVASIGMGIFDGIFPIMTN